MEPISSQEFQSDRSEVTTWGQSCHSVRVHVHELHASILQFMGFDPEKFTCRYAGRDLQLRADGRAWQAGVGFDCLSWR